MRFQENVDAQVSYLMVNREKFIISGLIGTQSESSQHSDAIMEIASHSPMIQSGHRQPQHWQA